MKRLLLCVAVVACASNKSAPSSSPVAAVPAAATAAAVVPAQTQPGLTAAEQQFRTWLAAFNASDRAKLVAFHDQYYPVKEGMPSIDDELQFRTETGGFEIKKIESSTPTRTEMLVKEQA